MLEWVEEFIWMSGRCVVYGRTGIWTNIWIDEDLDILLCVNEIQIER